MIKLQHTIKQEVTSPMKSITEIIGGAQILLSLAYDIQDSFEGYLSRGLYFI